MWHPIEMANVIIHFKVVILNRQIYLWEWKKYIYITHSKENDYQKKNQFFLVNWFFKWQTSNHIQIVFIFMK